MLEFEGLSALDALAWTEAVAGTQPNTTLYSQGLRRFVVQKWCNPHHPLNLNQHCGHRRRRTFDYPVPNKHILV